MIGPLEDALIPSAVVSRFGVIPKNHQPGKWRLIVDLSHPKGASVNDGIERVVLPEVCDSRPGSPGHQGGRLRKLNSTSKVPTGWSEDRYLLGMRWKGKLYIDAALPCQHPRYSRCPAVDL